MSVLDKIKNALFEVEYVEVEEPPKKEKKEKKEKERKEKKIRSSEKEVKENKPIAKKVILPNKKSQKVEEIEEETVEMEEINDNPKDVITDNIYSEKKDFKFIDDNDLEADNLYPEEPEILRVIEEKEISQLNNVADSNKNGIRERRYHEDKYEQGYEVDSNLEPTYNNHYDNSSNYHESKPYGMDNSYKIPVHEYGGYERKEEKPYFKPSPIISPIYGILDKNYKKEDVVQKKEVRISSYSRSNVSVDEIRNKAYGEDKRVESKETKFEVDNDNDESLLVDLSDKSKPEVKELTVGDAEEYFQDLGLEYNVDYVDVSHDNTKKAVTQVANKNEEKTIDEELIDAYKSAPKVEDDDNEKNKDMLDNDDDNLFDLIDSMYQEDE